MKEFLEEDEKKETVPATVRSQKKSNKKKTGGQGTSSTFKTVSGVRGGDPVIGTFKCHHRHAFPPDQQRLIFSDNHLEGRRTVTDYTIQRESTLNLVLRNTETEEVTALTVVSTTALGSVTAR